MKDPVKEIKAMYQTLLSDAIEFAGSPVKFRLGEGDIADNNSYIILSNIQAKNVDNKALFSWDITVSIDIYSKQKVLLSDPFNSVDVIADKALQLIIPSLNSTGLTSTADFEVKTWRVEDTSYSAVESITGNRMMKRTINIFQKLNEL
jgi:hypothetical protein